MSILGVLVCMGNPELFVEYMLQRYEESTSAQEWKGKVEKNIRPGGDSVMISNISRCRAQDV